MVNNVVSSKKRLEANPAETEGKYMSERPKTANRSERENLQPTICFESVSDKGWGTLGANQFSAMDSAPEAPPLHMLLGDRQIYYRSRRGSF